LRNEDSHKEFKMTATFWIALTKELNH